jgi:hypothetical protein
MCRCIFIRIANSLCATNKKQDSDLATDPQTPGCGVLDLCLFATWLAFTLRLDVLHWPQAAQ